MSGLRALVLAILDDVTHGRPPPASDDEPLELDSFMVVSLVEELEVRFGFRVSADEVLPANLATLDAVVAFVARKGAGGRA